MKFILNWHHFVMTDALEKVSTGEIKNLVINVPPGSSKTEIAVINFIAHALAKNPQCRFLHLSYADDLASRNSQASRELIRMDEYQELWPIQIADDSKSKKCWNVMSEGRSAGGVYATSLGGQITGFRAGHMQPHFQGAILLDDLLKPEDAFSKPKTLAANRKILTTIKSRKASPDTPIVLIMQRVGDNDPVQFIKDGNVPGEWTHVVIPAVLDEDYVRAHLGEKYVDLLPEHTNDDIGETRFSYWPYKEPLDQLLAMERGEGSDQTGVRISRHVFASQYQQNPVAMGGNIIRGEYFKRYKVMPELEYRSIFADTAQKTAERNDYSVFEVWGKIKGGGICLIDLVRGKWEGPELRKRAVDFWTKHMVHNGDPRMGKLRALKVEDKSSGTDLVQSLRLLNFIPISPIQRNKDKLTRVMDAAPYLEQGLVWLPEDAPFTNDFVTECEAFTSDDSHTHDDQIDPMLDAVSDMISTQNKMNVWAKLGAAEIT